MVDKSDIERIIREVERENVLFNNDKGCLDALTKIDLRIRSPILLCPLDAQLFGGLVP
ncbi:hypothetical protein NTE_03145 [Candidatus Nitrososphaera evergladensis SR1]|jgi:hypothetical protein|uniref:Uncharacterized protein n=1 Tax=Candidatus Nitrososphaera evergladensis SR1 TaxID=1459636 RepID=A0A075MX03_9ARCH|nr:hypothetical protein NTE_03145 [Candidatus Nitrososphaera evergladensis SR1]